MPDPFPTTALQSVYFDCDSTLSTIEGVDELAAHAPAEIRRQVVDLTNAAMDGTIAVEGVYARRLELMRPHRDAVAAIGDAYIEHAVPDVAEVVAALRALGKRVGIVSGGIRPAVLPLASRLGIDAGDVHAVDLRFADDGSYLDFDRKSPLARNGGKPEILAGFPPDHRPIAFVGDGITDLEAAPVVDRFIGFGGVARRPRVVAAAEFYVDGPSLAPVLQFCLTPAEVHRLREIPHFTHLIPDPTNP